MALPQGSKKRLALAIIDFLNSSLKDGTIGNEDSETVEVATQCIADTFHVDPHDTVAMRDAIGNQSLLSIYSVYEKLKDQSGAASAAKTEGDGSHTHVLPNTPSGLHPEAEKLKAEGNKAMQSKEYPKAIELYTQALALSPSNPIYLSNRAAAYSAASLHKEAADDAEKAVIADPKYTKAWSRLGLARFALGDPKASMDAYQKGIDAEGKGGSEAMKRGYETAKKRVAEIDGSSGTPRSEATTSNASPSASNMPDLAGLASMLGRGSESGGGMPDLGSLMSNPMFANMAQQVMNNPEMMSNLMSNPRLREMAEGFSGGNGGSNSAMPNLTEMMQDPSIAEMARNFMGTGSDRGN